MGKLTRATTKPMLKVKGKPLLEHKINALPRKIKEIILVVGYQSGHILAHFKRYFAGRRIIYVFQTNLNGTAGALHLTKSILKDKFIVMMGDDLYHRRDLEEIMKHDLAVMGHEVADPSLFGLLKTDKNGNLVNIVEKPKTSKGGFANIGLYVLNKKIFDYEMELSSRGEFYLTDIVAKMAKDHKIKVAKATVWHPIGNAQDFEKAALIIKQFI